MKNIIKFSFLLLAIFFTVTALTNLQNTTISGKVIPVDGVDRVWAVSDIDSVNVIPDKGVFILQVKPATYKIIVTAKPPYRDLVVEDIKVEEGKNTDVGELRLIQ